MANLKNFTVDEQLQILMIYNCEALVNKIAELTGLDADYITTSVSEASSSNLLNSTDNRVRAALKMHRDAYLTVRNRVMKKVQTDNN